MAKWMHKILHGGYTSIETQLNNPPKNMIYKILSVQPIDDKLVMAYLVWTKKDGDFNKPAKKEETW